MGVEKLETNEDKDYLINWDRSIVISEKIDDDLVRRLTPTILALRQKNNDPITVDIDSPGGSLASLDILLGLLTGPTQNHKSCQIITVATNRAYSAAANLLTFGTYAVALWNYIDLIDKYEETNKKFSITKSNYSKITNEFATPANGQH